MHYVDDSLSHEELVAAMRAANADALVSAIGFGAIALEEKLIDAAVEAGVKRFLPSEYGVNNTNPVARNLCPVFDSKGAVVEYLKAKEHTGLTWTAVPTGLWLDWYVNTVLTNILLPPFTSKPSSKSQKRNPEPNLPCSYRSLDPNISFADINIKTHTARLWQRGTHKLSWSTLPWSAAGIAQILLSPAATANKVVPLHGLSASQNDIVAALERLQGVKYEISHFEPTDEVVSAAQKSWEVNKDTESALRLVKAGFFLDGYGSDFLAEGIVANGNEYLPGLNEGGELLFEDIVKKALEEYA